MRVTGTAPYVAVLLPDEAIGTDQTNKYVLTVGEDGTVARKAHRARAHCSTACAWCAKGITGDEWVITRGLQRARPGQKVTPKRETLTVSEASADAAPRKEAGVESPCSPQSGERGHR